jgi:hypothetical protein
VYVHVDEAWGYDGSVGVENCYVIDLEAGANSFDSAVANQDVSAPVASGGRIDYASAGD